MPKIEPITTYKFIELDDFAKDRVRNAIKSWFPPKDWHDFILNKWKDQLGDIGFEGVDISYSGFWAKGDGASFTGEINLPVFLSKVNCIDIGVSTSRCTRLINALKSSNISIGVEVIKISTPIEHSSTLVVCLKIEKEFKRVKSLIGDITLQIHKFVKLTSNRIYKELAADYEAINTIEATDEFIKSINSDYLANGTVINLKK